MKTLNIVRSALVAIVLTGATLSVSAPALAADDTVQVKVSTRGFDLADPADQRLVQHKIRMIARQVCNNGASVDVRQRQAARRCFLDAVAKGNAQLASLEVRHGSTFAALDTSALPK